MEGNYRFRIPLHLLATTSHLKCFCQENSKDQQKWLNVTLLEITVYLYLDSNQLFWFYQHSVPDIL